MVVDFFSGSKVYCLKISVGELSFRDISPHFRFRTGQSIFLVSRFEISRDRFRSAIWIRVSFEDRRSGLGYGVGLGLGLG